MKVKQATHYYNPALKIKYLNSFKIDSKYKEDIDFFQYVINECNHKGYEALKEFSSKKLRSAENIYKIYAKLQGHRMSYVYASDIPNLKDNPDFKNTLIFIKYTASHDKQAIEAKRIQKNIEKHSEMLLINDLKIDVDIDEQLQSFDFGKIFKYNGTNDEFRLSPNFDEVQSSLIKLPSRSIIINGVAGSGKTSICIELFRKLCVQGKSALYVTFSSNLVNLAVSEKILLADNIEKIIKNLEQGIIYENLVEYIKQELRVELKATKKDEIIKELFLVLKNLNKIEIKTFSELYGKNYNGKDFADERYFEDFVQKYNCGKDYNLKAELDSIKISYELIFKEIYGLISGYLMPKFERKKTLTDYLLSEEEYLSLDEKYTVYTIKERKIIYKTAQKYLAFLKTNNKYDNNIIAYNLLKEKSTKKYDYLIIDEVQDLSELQILYLTKIGKILFCAGDVNQMVNPNYFDFNRVKDLLGAEKVENLLKINYRSSTKIVNMLNDITKLKQEKLGKWSNFDIIEKSSGKEVNSRLAFCRYDNILYKIYNSQADNYDIIVADSNQKALLIKNSNLPDISKKIMTVAEVKGLDKDFVVLYNILSSKEKDWNELLENFSKKQADANSKFRYIFNLFYVALTRTQQNMCIIESKENAIIKDFFTKDYFVQLTENTQSQVLVNMFNLRKLALTEWKERFDSAIISGDYERALTYAQSYIKDEIYIKKAEIYVELKENGDNLISADKLCDLGAYLDARVLYERAGQKELADFMKLLNSGNTSEVSINNMLKIYTTTHSEKIKQHFLTYYKNINDNLFTKSSEIGFLLKELN
ncbi:MAG: AAA family ATPase [Clostridia bacterium]|jgi:7,8-dihydro-6-hydroxymethylpterin-pyrophosphokinase|nr:AAA family ATPase [Clostridia bacterium]